MAFDKAESLVPESIGGMWIDMFNQPGPTDEKADFRVEIIYTNGKRRSIRGDLIPHLSAEEIVAARAFMALMRAKAEIEILP